MHKMKRPYIYPPQIKIISLDCDATILQTSTLNAKSGTISDENDVLKSTDRRSSDWEDYEAW